MGRRELGVVFGSGCRGHRRWRACQRRRPQAQVGLTHRSEAQGRGLRRSAQVASGCHFEYAGLSPVNMPRARRSQARAQREASLEAGDLTSESTGGSLRCEIGSVRGLLMRSVRGAITVLRGFATRPQGRSGSYRSGSLSAIGTWPPLRAVSSSAWVLPPHNRRQCRRSTSGRRSCRQPCRSL